MSPCIKFYSQSTDEYFSVPLEIVRRKLDGVRDSIASSKWRPSFTKALKSSPEFHITSLNSAVPYCDACHLGGRMSTFIGRLDGKPYDTTTFQVNLLWFIDCITVAGCSLILSREIDTRRCIQFRIRG